MANSSAKLLSFVPFFFSFFQWSGFLDITRVSLGILDAKNFTACL